MQDKLALYGYWRSSAAYRVRIALNLKGLAYEQFPVHLVDNGGEQNSDEFRAVNPQGLVPVLLHQGQVLTQSLAICEYLDERFSRYPLLPDDPVKRARVRSAALQVACDIHPLNNLRVQNYLRKLCGNEVDTMEWMSHWVGEGFAAIEQSLDHSRPGSITLLADHPGLFECFLVPQVYNAERFGTDLSAFPEIRRLAARCRKIPAFMDAAPENQPDALAV